MKKAIWNSSWLGIHFIELGIKLSFFKRASSIFYSKFYNELYKRYNNLDELPADYKNVKINTAKEISKLINKHDEILAYGCGIGFIEIELANNVEYKNLEAFDFNKKTPKWLIKNNKIQYVHRINKDKKYDLIYFTQVFYSMSDKEIELLISSFKSILSVTGKILTIDTSMKYYENGANYARSFVLKSKLKSIVYPLYLLIVKRKKNQFWGWSRDNKEIIDIFEKSGYKLIKSYSSSNQAFQLFVPNVSAKK